jgi:hypothetical protein
MGNTKGNSDANVGYSCEQRELVAGWRRVWSETPGTTDPNAPFGIVTLADSGGEGAPGAAMGEMHLAQTAGYGVLPGPPGSGMENTFVAQAYDLDDEWMGGGVMGPCFRHSYTSTAFHANCCGGKESNVTCTPEWETKCVPACAGTSNTPTKGGIHPRNKKPVVSLRQYNCTRFKPHLSANAHTHTLTHTHSLTCDCTHACIDLVVSLFLWLSFIRANAHQHQHQRRAIGWALQRSAWPTGAKTPSRAQRWRAAPFRRPRR